MLISRYEIHTPRTSPSGAEGGGSVAADVDVVVVVGVVFIVVSAEVVCTVVVSLVVTVVFSVVFSVEAEAETEVGMSAELSVFFTDEETMLSTAIGSVFDAVSGSETVISGIGRADSAEYEVSSITPLKSPLLTVTAGGFTLWHELKSISADSAAEIIPAAFFS